MAIRKSLDLRSRPHAGVAIATSAAGILGGMLLASARHDPKMAAWVIEDPKKGVTRDVDKKRLGPLLRELETRHAKRG